MNLHTKNFQGISDAIDRGCTRGDKMGNAIILLASHMGGRRI
jgi:hypothetical protein